MLQDSDGNEVTEHESMAALLWTDYKNRMGTTEGIDMQFDLDRIIPHVDGLEELTAPYTKKRWMMSFNLCQEIELPA
jgi:hypothetical protein